MFLHINIKKLIKLSRENNLTQTSFYYHFLLTTCKTSLFYQLFN